MDPVTGKSYTIYADDNDLPKPDHDYRRPAEEMLYPTRKLVQLMGGHHPDEVTPERDLVEADDLEPDGLNANYEDYRRAFIEDLVLRNSSGVRESIPVEFEDGRKTGMLGYQHIARIKPYVKPVIRPFDPREKPQVTAQSSMTEGSDWDADPRRPQQRTGTTNRAGNASMRDSNTEGTTDYKTERPGTQRPGFEQEVARGRMPVQASVVMNNAGTTKYETDRPGTQRPGFEQEVARGRMPVQAATFLNNAGTVRTSTERPGTQRPGTIQEVGRGRMPVQAAVHNAGTVRTTTERPGPQRVGDQGEVARDRMPAQAAVHNAGVVQTSTERPGTQRPGALNELPLLQSIVGTVTQGLQAAADAFTQRSRRGVADSVTVDNLAAYQDGLSVGIAAPGVKTEAAAPFNTRKSYFETRLDEAPAWGADNGDASGFDLFGAQSLRKPRSSADDMAMQAQIMRQAHDNAMYLPNPGYLA
ncbi:hypothetical protein [Asticcacaulis sp.]|uniref:hypothetical protein n=1 Tax=Asticcacaulis sp. TaxID=1872648 RepID=UPI00261AB274|nr:hypothetical protein [Asticcacaulis sp.]